MFRQHSTITLPTDLVVRDLISETNAFCQAKGLLGYSELSVYDAANVVACAIYDVLYVNTPFIQNKDTAEELLRKLLPWYNDPKLNQEYYSNVFDAVFYSTEKLLNELVFKTTYDVWDVRVQRRLTTQVTYLGDYRILEWEKHNNRSPVGDVYVGQEENPRIRGSLVTMGYYRQIHDSKVLSDVRNISKEIIDFYGNVVLTSEDISRGLTVR